MEISLFTLMRHLFTYLIRKAMGLGFNNNKELIIHNNHVA